MSENKEKQNPSTPMGEAISSLLTSGDAWVKLITLALIIITGTSNWFATREVGHENREDWKRGLNELHQFFSNQQTYLQGLQLLQQNNEDTKWIRMTLQANSAGLKSNSDELTALKAEIEKLKMDLEKK